MTRSDDLEIYESWQISIPAISHSYLNHLTPIGLNTPLVESLTSYLTRLAASHTMTVGALLRYEIARILDKQFVAANLQSIARVPGALNGIGSMSKDLVCALQELTMKQDLHLLTMLSFKDVIPSRNLLRSVRAWCPLCYQHWIDSGDILYEPLIWSLKAVNYCPTHQIYLSDKCPNCQQQNPSFGRNFQLGFCSQCHYWLGQNTQKQIFSEHPSVSDFWKVESLGALLSLAPDLRNRLSAVNITQQLSTLVSVVTKGNIAALSRRLKVPKNTLWLWCQGEFLPSLESSLDICYHFELSLVDFFSREMSENIDLDKWQSLKKQPLNVSSSRAFDSLLARTALERVLSQQEVSPPLSVAEIARQLGYSRRMLYKHFPDLCYSISAMYQERRQKQHQENLAYYCQQVRQIVVRLYAEGRYPSENCVAKRMDKPGFLRCQEVKSAFKLARLECKSSITSLEP